MGKTTNEVKQRFNDAHYVQIKVAVKPDVASAFKAACADSGVSMANVLSGFMSEYVGTAMKKEVFTNQTRTYFTSTRGNRRRGVKELIQKMEQIRDAEEQYQENIPENLKSSKFSEAAQESVSVLNEVIELLETAY